MPHSKTPTTTKPARAKTDAKRPGKPQNKPVAPRVSAARI
jgi:hypothetical protein